MKLIRDASVSIQDEAREKRDSLKARVAKMTEIINGAPGEHFILWHDLETERHAIKAALPEAVEVTARWTLTSGKGAWWILPKGERACWPRKRNQRTGLQLSTALSPGCFLGIDYKFNDFIQAIHRIYRFLQTQKVVIDIIYTESEEQVRKRLKKWRQRRITATDGRHCEKYGLHDGLIEERMCGAWALSGEICGERYKAVHADCVRGNGENGGKQRRSDCDEHSVFQPLRIHALLQRLWPQ
ncbi:MAG: hypothetical protein ACLUI3_03155 [Christensenellales bacterium]